MYWLKPLSPPSNFEEPPPCSQHPWETLHVRTRMSSVCHSFVLVSHPYITLMYSYFIHMLLVCTRMSSVCHSYVLVCHPYVTRMWFYHEPILTPPTFWTKCPSCMTVTQAIVFQPYFMEVTNLISIWQRISIWSKSEILLPWKSKISLLLCFGANKYDFINNFVIRFMYEDDVTTS